jgi:hypothetical protein
MKEASKTQRKRTQMIKKTQEIKGRMTIEAILYLPP